MKSFQEKIKNDKFLIIIPFVTISIRLIIFLFIPHTYEDAFITFRYAENLAEGNGLVYNFGERVYGTTTPLFAVLIAAFHFIGISSIISSLIINLAAEGITSLVVYKFLKDFSYAKAAAIVALLFVFSPSNISWSIQGMETAFFSCIIALAFFSLYKKKYFLALLFGFLSAMIRIDGLSVTFIILLFSTIELKQSVIRPLLIPLFIFLIWLAFLYLYFGSFLPNSMMAKLILYSGHQESILPNLNLVLSKFFTAGYYSSSIMTLLFISGIFLIFKEKLRLLPIAIWFIVYYSALIISRTVIHGWYLIPPLFVYITIAGITVIYIFNFIQKKTGWNINLVHSFLLAGVSIFSILVVYQKVSQIRMEYQYEVTVRKEIGRFLNDHTPANSSVFLEPIGAIGYYSQRYIYDDAALVSPIFLEFNKMPNNAVTRFKKIQFVKPDYLVIRDKYLDEFYKETNLLSEYSDIKNFKFHLDPDHPEFVAMTVFERKEN